MLRMAVKTSPSRSCRGLAGMMVLIITLMYVSEPAAHQKCPMESRSLSVRGVIGVRVRVRGWKRLQRVSRVRCSRLGLCLRSCFGLGGIGASLRARGTREEQCRWSGKGGANQDGKDAKPAAIHLLRGRTDNLKCTKRFQRWNSVGGNVFQAYVGDYRAF